VKKLALLLLDANVVIEISRHHLWDCVLARYTVYLSETVVSESQFYEDDEGNRTYIDLSESISTGQIILFSILPSDLKSFFSKFDPTYLEKLDPGESESLFYLLQSPADRLICSADKIVYRVLGALNATDSGISLDEVLSQAGYGRRLSPEFGREYRQEWTQRGFRDAFWGTGVK
jgi:hypothetical protein